MGNLDVKWAINTLDRIYRVFVINELTEKQIGQLIDQLQNNIEEIFSEGN